jgi:hypothetical protein
MVGDKTAIAVRLFIEVPNGWQANVRRVKPERGNQQRCGNCADG